MCWNFSYKYNFINDGKVSTKTNVNLTTCSKSKISIYKHFIINDNIDKYNYSSGYYNDICYTTTSKDGIDVSLKDRQTNSINENKVICQEDCEFSEYDYITFIAKCSCNVKESSEFFAGMSIDRVKLILNNFKDIQNLINFDFLVCYKKLFKKKGITENIGSYIILVIIFFHLITIFIFYLKQFSILKKEIKNIIFEIKGTKVEETKSTKRKKKLIRRKKNNKNKYKISKRNNIPKIGKESSSKTVIKVNNEIETVKNKIKYIDEEINELPYDLAILYDKRTYCKFYVSLIKTKHNLIFALSDNDYNSRIIKIDLFLIGFAVEYAVNALFYNDNTMHNIYQNKGQYDLKAQIPIIIYSYLISIVLNIPLNILALSSGAIIAFKNIKSKINLLKKAKELIKILNVKFILYFIIIFLLLSFFWYYIAMFCVIYKNTQIHLLKDTIMSFGLSLLFPFGFYLLPGFFRIPSLSNPNNKRKCLYNFSKILQLSI